MLARWWTSLASLKLTLVIFILFLLSVVLVYISELSPGWILALPFLLFALNLSAAITTNPKFRRQTGLLVFHLALLTLVLLLAASRLSYLKGSLEITEDEAFDGLLTDYEAGPLHPWHLDEVHFTQLTFTIDYDPGLNRGRTRSEVLWLDENGQPHESIIGDHHALIIAGYRFYTTHNKGFAPTFAWLPKGASTPQQGSIHLPAYPAHEFQQALDWTIPGSRQRIWTQLVLEQTVLDENRPSIFRAPERYHLVMRFDGQRRELHPGESLQFDEGRLTFVGLKTWMGYQVFYDWTIPWLLGACVVAILALGWHYRQKWAARPWLAGDEDEGTGR